MGMGDTVGCGGSPWCSWGGACNGRGAAATWLELAYRLWQQGEANRGGSCSTGSRQLGGTSGKGETPGAQVVRGTEGQAPGGAGSRKAGTRTGKRREGARRHHHWGGWWATGGEQDGWDEGQESGCLVSTAAFPAAFPTTDSLPPSSPPPPHTQSRGGEL